MRILPDIYTYFKNDVVSLVGCFLDFIYFLHKSILLTIYTETFCGPTILAVRIWKVIVHKQHVFGKHKWLSCGKYNSMIESLLHAELTAYVWWPRDLKMT